MKEILGLNSQIESIFVHGMCMTLRFVKTKLSIVSCTLKISISISACGRRCAFINIRQGSMCIFKGVSKAWGKTDLHLECKCCLTHGIF